MSDRKPFQQTITQEQIDRIIHLRKTYRLRYTDIADIVGVSTYSVRRYVHKHLRKKERHIVRSVTRKEPPKNVYVTNRDYDFLQYIRPVFKWATSNSGLSRRNVELLLYLYSKGVFKKSEFYKYHMILGIYQARTFDMFVKKGYIVMWRDKKRNHQALYSLTNKAKILCSKMHKFLVGELDIPTNPAVNNLAKPDGDRINGYYMDVIKKMNKERRGK